MRKVNTIKTISDLWERVDGDHIRAGTKLSYINHFLFKNKHHDNQVQVTVSYTAQKERQVVTRWIDRPLKETRTDGLLKFMGYEFHINLHTA